MDESEAVDLSSSLVLRQLQKPGAPDAVGRILGRFLEETPQRMAALHSALARDDARGLEQAAHALKGIAGTVGANEMASIAHDLELRGRAGATAGALQRVTDLQAAYERAQPLLNELRLPGELNAPMRSRPFASMDALTLGLIALGAVLVAAAIVGLAVLAEPTRATPDAPSPPQTISDSLLQPDSVATVLRLDTAAGVAGAAKVGDHVDVLGYFPRRAASDENVTRLLAADAPVLSATQDGSNLSLTLAVPQSTALLLHEAQALGARPFVLLRSTDSIVDYSPRLTDTELAARLSEGAR